MKKYQSLGELLVDYRKLNRLSQSDLAASLDVDIRTVIRWEKDETLVKPDKENDLVETTFIPYQVIRNLNATKAIPTFYSFKYRKYSLTEISVELPWASALQSRSDYSSPGIQSIAANIDQSVPKIQRYHRYLYKTDRPLSEWVIAEAAKLLPELNLIEYDGNGYYSGHSVVLPIKYATYERLRNKEINEGEITRHDLVNYTFEEKPVFYGYSIYADCNDNIHFIMNSVNKFFQNLNGYLFTGLAVRPDAIQLLKDLGLKKVWEEDEVQVVDGVEFRPVFMEGDFSKFDQGNITR